MISNTIFNKHLLSMICFTWTLTSLNSVCRADVKPARLFSDNMVIQRDVDAPVWGVADAGEKISVAGDWGARAATKAGKDGRWMVNLSTPKAGGPYKLTIKGNNTVTISNVLSGDVWLCSGQSNMQFTVDKTVNKSNAKKDADYPNIRHFKVEQVSAYESKDDCNGNWQVSNASNVMKFSGVAFFTGRELHKQLNVPIGLINASWGGTIVEAWTQKSAQLNDPNVKSEIDRLEKVALTFDAEKAEKHNRNMMTNYRKLKKAGKNPGWPKKISHPTNGAHFPGNLFNGMINPLMPFAVKGAIWYQGESNSKTIESSFRYRTQLDKLITTWRTAWKQDLPFYFVQLPKFKAPQSTPISTTDKWPVTRDSFNFVNKNTPDTAMVAIIDLGEAKDIHPRNKLGVGKRMASTILNKSYGKNTPTTPVYKSYKIEDGKMIISFEYTGEGLVAKGGALKAFAVAGADKKFAWADVVIEKQNGEDVVVVSSSSVSEIKSVRYAWANNPSECNLYSDEGFPASPFRTDDWDLSTD